MSVASPPLGVPAWYQRQIPASSTHCQPEGLRNHQVSWCLIHGCDSAPHAGHTRVSHAIFAPHDGQVRSDH